MRSKRITGWQSYTATLVGWTTTNMNLQYMQHGGSYIIRGSLGAIATTSGSHPTFTLPNSQSIDTGKINATAYTESFGVLTYVTTSGTTASAKYAAVYNGTATLLQICASVASDLYKDDAASTIFSAGPLVNIEYLIVPILGLI